MISVRPDRPFIRCGVTGLMLLAFTPLLFGAEGSSQSPVVVESLSGPAASQAQAPARSQPPRQSNAEIEYRPPIEEAPADERYGEFENQHQMQLLQQEVQELRGLVEQLSYQLERIRKTQEERYLDLDSRFQNLQDQINQGATAGSTGSIPGAVVETPDPQEVVRGEGDEDELYGIALELIRNRQYDQAIDQLNALIKQYPDGALIANAYYWLGEVYAAKPEPDYEQARQALAQVITFFPDHRKVPDAAFKLGKVYHLMGDCDRARELLTQVMKDYSGKSVANLAERYLRDQVDCSNE